MTDPRALGVVADGLRTFFDDVAKDPPLPETTIAAEWPLPGFEDVAKVTAAFDADVGGRVTITQLRTGTVVAMWEWES